ncbi:MAG: transcriptional regulator NrdR [Dehalococcoidia bacterium]|nr:transcriptional regulator NrdR [Dehalococcoidia bacterium]
MKCPYCGSDDSRVVDSRDTTDGVRRRRECISCQVRFTTYERLQPVNLYVIKKDLRQEEFNKEKLLTGIRKACEKRPLVNGAVEKLADDVETELFQMGKSAIPTSLIGDLVMLHLKKLDNIAYIRFASVYRDFTDITDLKQEVDTLLDHLVPPDGQLVLPINS